MPNGAEVLVFLQIERMGYRADLWVPLAYSIARPSLGRREEGGELETADHEGWAENFHLLQQP